MTHPLPTLKRAFAALSIPPHTVSQFVAIILDNQQLSDIQKQEAWQHLATCVQCQAFLVDYLLTVIADDETHGESKGIAQELLTQLTSLMHDTLKEDIPGYTEKLAAQGEAAANLRYPLFAQHVPICHICQFTVRNMLEWLHHDTDDDDL